MNNAPSPNPEGDRRVVTVLFADLVGYTAVSESHDPEEIHEALHVCFERLAADVRQFGGVIDKIVGDELMALFGAPRAQHDDAGRAVAAALSMLRSLDEMAPEMEQRLGVRLQARIGVNSGMVVAAPVGPGAFTVTGDAVNVAARLEKASEPGCVLVGDATRELTIRPFGWIDRREITVKGRTEPVVCFTPRDDAASASPMLITARGEGQFVGRESELRQLGDMWRGLMAGGGIVQITGEGGIGKTRLLSQFFAAEGITQDQVLYVRSESPPRAFGPLLNLLPLDQRPRVALSDQNAEPALQPEWLAEAVTRIVAQRAVLSHVALVIDDLHLADRGTLDLMPRLLRRLSQLPVLTVLLARPHENSIDINQAQRITLQPLPEDEARELVAHHAARLGPDTAAAVLSRAGGNPLFVEILSRSATSGGAVPDTAYAAVSARVDGLDELSRGLLLEASVLGEAFDEGLLTSIATEPRNVRDTLRGLCQRGFLEKLDDSPPGYGFRHAVVQQVLYQTFLRPRRRTLHARAAQSLAAALERGMSVPPEQIAYHFEQAGEREEAARYLLIAAEVAERLRAPGLAREQRRRANGLLSALSLASTYAGRDAGLRQRALSGGIQLVAAVGVVLPLFATFVTRPSRDYAAIGLPVEAVDFSFSAVLLAAALFALPLLVTGVIFSHLAAPTLMRRGISRARLAGTVAIGWLMALAAIAIAGAAVIGLVHLGWLDKTSSIYVAVTTLAVLEGAPAFPIFIATGTLALAFVWTMTLRMLTRAWSSPAPPAKSEEAPDNLAGHAGVVLMIAGALSGAALVLYQSSVVRNDEVEATMSTLVFSLMLAGFIAAMGGGASILWLTTRRVTGARRRIRSALGTLGFEAPLVTALLFGLAGWYIMRDAVLQAASDLESPGDVRALDRTVGLYPHVAFAYYLRGTRYHANGISSHQTNNPEENFARAEQDFNRTIELDPQFAAAYLARVGSRIFLGSFAQQDLDDVNHVISVRPDHPVAYGLRGLLTYQHPNGSAPEPDLERVLEPLPRDAAGWGVYSLRCAAAALLDMAERAVEECTIAIERNPGFTSNWTQRARAYGDLGRHAEEEADISRAIELAVRPVDLDGALSSRAFLRLARGDSAGAMEDANRRQAIASSDEHRDVLGISIEFYTRSDRYQLALYTGIFDNVINDLTWLLDHPEQVDKYDRFQNYPTGRGANVLLADRGYAHLLTGERELGLADIDASLAANPDQARARIYRAYAHIVAGEFELATADLDDADRLFDAQTYHFGGELGAQIHLYRATILFEQHEDVLARHQLDQGLEEVGTHFIRRALEALRDEMAAEAP